MEILKIFFENMGLKFSKEPKLSDMIWVMCSTSELFKKIFLEYCFEKEISVEGEIIREYNKNGSIPDFYFMDRNGIEYIIENKIFDRGDHFEQYTNEFPNAIRAFIANYSVPEHTGWYIKTWKDFIIELDKIICNNKSDKEEICLMESFVLYLKSVNYFWEAKTMNFSHLSSLNDFYGIISEIIEQMGFQKYNVPSAINSEYYGQYFYYTNKNGENVYIWMGLYIPEDSGVYIKFQSFQNESWLPKSEQRKIKNLTVGEYYDNAGDEYYKKLCDNIDVNIQKEILKNFLEEIINFFITLFSLLFSYE